MALRS